MKITPRVFVEGSPGDGLWIMPADFWERLENRTVDPSGYYVRADHALQLYRDMQLMRRTQRVPRDENWVRCAGEPATDTDKLSDNPR